MLRVRRIAVGRAAHMQRPRRLPRRIGPRDGDAGSLRDAARSTPLRQGGEQGGRVVAEADELDRRWAGAGAFDRRQNGLERGGRVVAASLGAQEPRPDQFGPEDVVEKSVALAAARRSCPAASGSTAAVGSPPADPAGDLLAELQRRLDEAADGIAAHADAARIAGQACQQSYDALTP